MLRFLGILGISIFFPFSVQAACQTASINPYSEITSDGASRNSDPGTVSEGTILIDAGDLKRKKCSAGQWQDLPYDGANVTPAHPGQDGNIEKIYLNAARRSVLQSMGVISCSGGTGTGFVFNMAPYGASAQRSYDLVATSCHVVASGSDCSFRPFTGFHQPPPGLESIAAQLGPALGAPLPFTNEISENGCAEFRRDRVATNKRTARKDWVFGVVGSKIQVADEARIQLVNSDPDTVKRISKSASLATFGFPPKKLKLQMPGSDQPVEKQLLDIVYSTRCEGEVRLDNIVHDCMTFPGMSGGPLGYFGSDGRFYAFGINSWAGGLGKELHRKQAAQISRGGATALTGDAFQALHAKAKKPQ